MGASAVLPPLVRDQTVDLRNLPSLPTCPIEPKPAGTSRSLRATRARAPWPVDTNAHATWRTLARAIRGRYRRTVRDTVRRVSRQEPTRCSRRRSRDRSPLTTCAHSERTQPLAPLGEPHRARWRWLRSSRRRAQTLRSRSSTTSNTWPWEIGACVQPSTRTTLWCFAHRCRHLRHLSATIPGQRCCHRIPATGFRRTDGCPLCCHRRPPTTV